MKGIPKMLFQVSFLCVTRNKNENLLTNYSNNNKSFFFIFLSFQLHFGNEGEFIHKTPFLYKKNVKKGKLHFLINYFFNKKSFVTSNKIKYLKNRKVEKTNVCQPFLSF